LHPANVLLSRASPSVQNPNKSANFPLELSHFRPVSGGGPPVWTAYAPFIRHWDITRLPYDGAADRWFDPTWIVAG